MATRLLVVGDLHGKTDVLFRLIESEKPDGILGVGDWGDAGQIAPETWADLLDRVPVATVFGNHDDIALLIRLQNRDGSPVLLGQGEVRPFCGVTAAGVGTGERVLRPLEKSVREFCGLTLAGVSGIWAKSHKKPYWVTDDDVENWAKQIQTAAPNIDILLTHGCPVGIVDATGFGKPGGQKCFLRLLQAVRPRIYCCGHLHVPQTRTISDPPCVAFNTGELPRGNYVRIEKSDFGELSSQLCRLPLDDDPAP